MTKDDLITVPVGTTLEQAKEILHRHKVEKLLVVDKRLQPEGPDHGQGHPEADQVPERLQGLAGPPARGRGGGRDRRTSSTARPPWSRPRWTWWWSTPPTATRSKRARHGRAASRSRFPDLEVIAGNVGTYEGAADLIAAGVAAVKVGMGPGSICTTRVVSGRGHAPDHGHRRGRCARRPRPTCPIIADGGIKFSGDVVKAIAAGASSVMIGSLFAGTDESPGELILRQGRSFKSYRGMGSHRGHEGRLARPLLPGVRGQRAEAGARGHRGHGPLQGAALRHGAAARGRPARGHGLLRDAAPSATCRRKARFVRISSAGLKESHVHDVIITKEAPNYRLE